jgi:hypothetical protein
MKRFSILIIAALLVMSSCASASAQAMAFPVGTKGWMFDVTTAVPLFKIVESEGNTSQMDVLPMLGLGGGLTMYWGLKDDPDNKKVVSINFPTLAMSLRDSDDKKMDLTLIADVGFFDNFIRFGCGYEMGKLAYERSRFIGVFSLGVSF